MDMVTIEHRISPWMSCDFCGTVTSTDYAQMVGRDENGFPKYYECECKPGQTRLKHWREKGRKGALSLATAIRIDHIYGPWTLYLPERS